MKDFLKNKRRELGLDQTQMAEKMRITSNNGNHTIMRWEKNVVYPKATDLWDLKEAYQMTDEEFLSWMKFINQNKKENNK